MIDSHGALRRLLGVVTAVFLAWPAVAGAGESPLRVERVLGGEDEDLLLHRPAYVAFAADGSAFVLNRGNSTVLRFGSDWALLGTFGAPGEGPGEFAQPTGMFVHGDEVCVVETTRITVYSLEGAYLGTRMAQAQLQEPATLGGAIIARLGAGTRAAAVIDSAGTVLREIGPACPEDFFSSFRECGNLCIVAHPAALCMMVNPFDGQAHVVGEDGEVIAAPDLIGGEGFSSMTEEDDGESVSMTLSFKMGVGCFYAERFWFPVYGDDPADEVGLVIFGRDLKPAGPQQTFPDGAQPFRLVPTPRGEMLLIDEMGSTIHVCRLRENTG